MVEQIVPVLFMLLGVAVHIAKKAMKLRQLHQDFDLSDYLIGHPYQTFLTVVAGGAAYLTLWESAQPDPVAWSAAFFAGVAANSLGDIAPGTRDG